MIAFCTKIHLCDSCVYEFATCEAKNIEFGNGKGNDNVIDCDCFNNGDKSITCPKECVC